MSKKRPPSDYSNVDNTSKGQSNNGSSQQDDNAKRAKLVSLSDTTLEDLPMELLERILIEVVAAEVLEKKLVKSVWKEKADLLKSRIGTVCSQWSNILSTDSFRIRLHRVLDGTDQKPMRLETIVQYQLALHARCIATLGPEIYVLHGLGYVSVFDRTNLETSKAVITLEPTTQMHIAACTVSNCIYVLSKLRADYITLLCITKKNENSFSVSTVVDNYRVQNSVPSLAVTTNGSLVVQSRKNNHLLLWIFRPDGRLQNQLKINYTTPASHYVVAMRNGNLLVVTVTSEARPTLSLIEIDMSGEIVRNRCSLDPTATTCQVDAFGHILLSNFQGCDQLLDSEFNLMDFTPTQHPATPRLLHYDTERDEAVTVALDMITICKLEEE